MIRELIVLDVPPQVSIFIPSAFLAKYRKKTREKLQKLLTADSFTAIFPLPLTQKFMFGSFSRTEKVPK